MSSILLYDRRKSVCKVIKIMIRISFTWSWVYLVRSPVVSKHNELRNDFKIHPRWRRFLLFETVTNRSTALMLCVEVSPCHTMKRFQRSLIHDAYKPPVKCRHSAMESYLFNVQLVFLHMNGAYFYQRTRIRKYVSNMPTMSSMWEV